MTSVFGMCEMEQAAILILDTQWERPFDPIDPAIFTGNDLARVGYFELQAHGWIDKYGVATRSFWERVHGR
jgi:hypothetical protein